MPSAVTPSLPASERETRHPANAGLLPWWTVLAQAPQLPGWQQVPEEHNGMKSSRLQSRTLPAGWERKMPPAPTRLRVRASSV